MNFPPFLLAKATTAQWLAWSATNVLTNGRIVMVVDTAQVAVENAKPQVERNYRSCISLWAGVRGQNKRIYVGDYEYEPVPIIHTDSIASWSRFDDEFSEHNKTNFWNSGYFNYDDAVMYVQHIMGLHDGIQVEDLTGFVDGFDTTGVAPSAYLIFQTDGTVTPVSTSNKSPVMPGQGDVAFAGNTSHDVVVYNPTCGLPFIGKIQNGKYYDSSWIGIPFGFTRNSIPFAVPVWVAPQNSKTIKYSDGKPVIFTLPQSGGRVVSVLPSQHVLSIDLINVVNVNDTVYIQHPGDSHYHAHAVVNRTETSITLDYEIPNNYGETIYLNVWVDGVSSTVDTDHLPAHAARIAATIHTNVVDTRNKDHGSVSIAGVDFPYTYKVIGEISIDSEQVGFTSYDDLDNPDEYATSIFVMDGNNVVGVRSVQAVIGDTPNADAPVLNAGNVEYYANRAGVVVGKTYILPLTDYDTTASRSQNIPAMRVIGVTAGNDNLLQIDVEPTPIAEVASWMRAHRSNIGALPSIIRLAIAQRAAVVEVGMIRGTNKKIVTVDNSNIAVDRLIHMVGLRINNEPDNPVRTQQLFGDPTNAWSSEIDPTDSSKVDRYPDVYNNRDNARFTKVLVDQLGSPSTSDVPLGAVRSLRANRILLDTPQSLFNGTERIGLSHVVNNNVPLATSPDNAIIQGVRDVAVPTSRLTWSIDPVATANAIDPTTNNQYSSNIQLRDMWLSATREFDIFHNYGGVFPVTGVVSKQVSTRETVVCSLPESFADTSMLSRHSGNANGYDLYRITLVGLQAGWSFTLVIPDLSMLNQPHPDTRLIICGTRYQPKSYQRFPSVVEEGLNLLPPLLYRRWNGTRFITKSTRQMQFFGPGAVNTSTGIDPRRRLAARNELHKSIPHHPLILRVTCYVADHEPEMPFVHRCRYIVDNLSPVSVNPAN
jgi:hypothetical protein